MTPQIKQWIVRPLIAVTAPLIVFAISIYTSEDVPSYAAPQLLLLLTIAWAVLILLYTRERAFKNLVILRIIIYYTFSIAAVIATTIGIVVVFANDGDMSGALDIFLKWAIVLISSINLPILSIGSTILKKNDLLTKRAFIFTALLIGAVMSYPDLLFKYEPVVTVLLNFFMSLQ